MSDKWKEDDEEGGFRVDPKRMARQKELAKSNKQKKSREKQDKDKLGFKRQETIRRLDLRDTARVERLKAQCKAMRRRHHDR